MKIIMLCSRHFVLFLEQRVVYMSIYEATSSRRNRSLAKELTTGALASFFLFVKNYNKMLKEKDCPQMDIHDL
ncbi:hypothetical protein SADUNF_Sadunf06G0120600 [Salix dunnii]|uniref:Uncharacterized protein n=1 Tax=Salix dunnii TaxID=1413687 RepID=A0A835JYU7_9ROSI|nr:hypothetical protein SADUNF_Sadunf06G0120600 [Salix dunnii]